MPVDLSKLKLGAQPSAPETPAAEGTAPGANWATSLTVAKDGALMGATAQRARSLDGLEEAERTDMQRVADAFAGAAKAESASFQQQSDTEFWFAVAFQTREAKNEFLSRAGWLNLGDKFLCGEDLAALLGVELTINVLVNVKQRPLHARLAALIDRPDAT